MPPLHLLLNKTFQNGICIRRGFVINKMAELFDRLSVLVKEKTRVREFLFLNNDCLKPEDARLRYGSVYRAWYNNELAYTRLPDHLRTPDVEKTRDRFREAEQDALDEFHVACLEKSAGDAYRRVLDEIKTVNAMILDNLRARK